jgi:hypothetical protein
LSANIILSPAVKSVIVTLTTPVASVVLRASTKAALTSNVSFPAPPVRIPPLAPTVFTILIRSLS